MMSRDDLLVEIFTEELPPKALLRLSDSFLNELTGGLKKAALAYTDASVYVTPRRLAVIVKDLIKDQPTQQVERKGPALNAAFDATGKPTPACLGFARSCGVDVDQLITLKTPQGEWMGYTQMIAGKSIHDLLPTIVQQSLAALPIPKRMRWGEGSVEFIRPIHAVTMLYGNDIVEATIMGHRVGRVTYGHRIHSAEPIELSHPQDYLALLEKPGHVIANFNRRKEMIAQQAEDIVKKTVGPNAKALLAPELLDEVAGLVEWPTAICGRFDAEFLNVPAEVLISSMQDHQRYFPVVDEHGKLLPYFVGVMNISPSDSQNVTHGNERVLRARLSDAAFFFNTDQHESLEQRLARLKGVVFQAKLGSLWDKSERIAALAAFIAEKLKLNTELAKRAGLLAKADLTSNMVGEFPELQGVMGYYYALHDKEKPDVALAIKEHYSPKFAGDELPTSELGYIVALADRIDTLVGVFGINQLPTGDKDPFALRRAAIGVLRILIEKELNLDLKELLEVAINNYQHRLENPQIVTQLLNFIQERLKAWYLEQGLTPDIFAAVAALNTTTPFDFYQRVQAVRAFNQLPEAEALSQANKRVSNILAQQASNLHAETIESKLFEHAAEAELAAQLDKLQHMVMPLYQKAQYVEVLTQLAALHKPINNFFDHVLVMADDPAVRANRLLLLSKLRALFLLVADVALLQG